MWGQILHLKNYNVTCLKCLKRAGVVAHNAKLNAILVAGMSGNKAKGLSALHQGQFRFCLTTRLQVVNVRRSVISGLLSARMLDK